MYGPIEPPETLDETAIFCNEAYLAYRKTGFTPHQIWHLLLQQVDCANPECHME